MAGALAVYGLRNVMRGLADADRDLKRGLTHGLREVARPVAETAEEFARGRIPNIGDQWPRMRVGVTQKVTYVAPRQRNKGGSKRPKFGTMLMERAMVPALERHEAGVVRAMERLLDRMADGFN